MVDNMLDIVTVPLQRDEQVQFFNIPLKSGLATDAVLLMQDGNRLIIELSRGSASKP